MKMNKIYLQPHSYKHALNNLSQNFTSERENKRIFCQIG